MLRLPCCTGIRANFYFLEPEHMSQYIFKYNSIIIGARVPLRIFYETSTIALICVAENNGWQIWPVSDSSSWNVSCNYFAHKEDVFHLNEDFLFFEPPLPCDVIGYT